MNILAKNIVEINWTAPSSGSSGHSKDNTQAAVRRVMFTFVVF